MNIAPQQKTFNNHPRVKIYYLKNDPSTKNPTQHYTSPITAPSITCLSSFIQKQKNHLANEQHQHFWLNFNLEEQQQNQQAISIPIISLTQPNPFLRNTSKIRPTQNNPQGPFTTELKPAKSPIRSNTIHKGSPNHKRFIKTSQEKYFQSHQNNEALSKDFLCNIVKEWNTFTQRERTQLKKSVLHRRKQSIDCHKVYRPEEIEQMKKNKSLMKQHFSLFLQNQKAKSTKKKQKSLTLLKAIFHREQSSEFINNKDLQTPEFELKDFKASKTESIPRAKTSSNSNHSQRRFSVNEKNPRSKYFRLLYGPEVKLIPRLFQEKSKIKNFDWTKLDKKEYEQKRKNVDSPKIFQF